VTETEDYDKSATPTAHAESHEDGGADEMDITGLAGGFDDADARAAIGNIFGADGKADAEIDLDYKRIKNINSLWMMPWGGVYVISDDGGLPLVGSSTEGGSSHIMIYGKAHPSKPNVIEFYLAAVLKAWLGADGVFHLVEQPSMTWDHASQHETGGSDEITGFAETGANASITSLTGLNDDGIPVEKIDSSIERALLFDSTKGRNLRAIIISIWDGTVDATIGANAADRGNGDVLADINNLARGGTVGSFSLNAAGHTLSILGAAVTGNPVGVLGCSMAYCSTGTALNPNAGVSGGNINITFSNAATGDLVDLTTLVNLGAIALLLVYVTDA